MNEINRWIAHIAQNYVLIVIAAVLFFAVKAVIGFYTYKHYNKQLEHLHHQVDYLIQAQKNLMEHMSIQPDPQLALQQKEDHTELSNETHMM